MRKCMVCAIIVTFNRDKLLRKCIDSLKKTKGNECDILIVDNSDEKETGLILQNYTDIKLICNKENNGCAGGIRQALREVVSEEYKYAWILDDDMVVQDDALCYLVDAAGKLNNQFSCLSGGVFWKDGTISRPNRPKKGIFTFVSDKEYSRDMVRISMASWGSLFINTDVIKEKGYPISDYFIYTDDYEYSYRLGKCWGNYFIPHSKVLHLMENNRKANVAKDTVERLNRYYYLFRNDMHFYKNFGIKGYFYLIIKTVYYIFQILLFSKDEKGNRLMILIRGMNDGLSFIPKEDYYYETNN